MDGLLPTTELMEKYRAHPASTAAREKVQTMPNQCRFRSPALQSLHDLYVGDDPERVASFERALDDANIAMSLYSLRTEAGLSQRELAARVGTTASASSRLEDGDYEGHSMAMLRRIATALGRRVEIRFPTVAEPVTAVKVPTHGREPASGRKAGGRSTKT